MRRYEQHETDRADLVTSRKTYQVYCLARILIYAVVNRDKDKIGEEVRRIV